MVARALAARPAVDAIVFGDVGILQRAARQAGVGAALDDARLAALVRPITALAAGEVEPGRPGLVSARAQLAYLTAATDAALAGEIAALVTAPISKEWIARAGFDHPGPHRISGGARRRHRVRDDAGRAGAAGVLATTHVALRDVPPCCAARNRVGGLPTAARALRERSAWRAPRVAVAGLNPHAGEAGRFGDEETRLVVRPSPGARRLAAAGSPPT